MNGLHEKLLYMRSLVENLNQLNKKENTYKTQIASILPNEVHVEKKLSKTYFLVIAIIAAGLLLMATLTFVDDLQRAQEYDVVDDEFQWVMNHPGEDYPGYEEDPSLAMSIFINDFGPMFFIIAIVVGGGFVFIKQQNTSKKKIIAENNTKIEKQNNENKKKNLRLNNEFSVLNREREAIYVEITKNLQAWYPKDYCYLSAIDYFINLVENHMAETIQRAVELYLDDMRYRITNQKLDRIVDGMVVMINNQKIIISNQDRMIQQQIIGNCINAANLANNMAMREEMRKVGDDVKRATDAARSAANSAAWAAKNS
ncbi:MAG: hypothetical protein PWR12_1210 [Eubacteriaceae bacterium]|nr:hypothetical protein [Eubacteriaceae bacterium]MDK2905134.1 hypothetical protein [Eubacteriaceae bacterium]MDK2937496.1 hypothetical protein [Eubacteriaceae bacterium]MDK2961376.1 hypothetical protein [Eubacteriaceae bacterium]